MSNEERRYNDSIFWVEVDRIIPNPYQPRKTFDEDALAGLAESIRQYGLLQPVVVTRKETERDNGIYVEYELISGERRVRAAKMVGVRQLPAIIRTHEDTDREKLELAIIENLQREDINPVDRARAFQQLAEEFELQHKEIGKRIGKSRMYVSNTIRILKLSEEMLNALSAGDISEGHTRPLLMLADKPDEQQVLFKEIVDKHMTVRESERIARRIAVDKARKKDLSPELLSMEREMTERLGTRVTIERTEKGGKVHIDFFSDEDLDVLRQSIMAARERAASGGSASWVNKLGPQTTPVHARSTTPLNTDGSHADMGEPAREPIRAPENAPAQEPQPEDDLYSVRNFTV